MPNVNPKVSIFTAQMRTEFLKAYNALRPIGQAPWTSFVQEIASTARIEIYPWMSPPPRLKRWMGKRRYAMPDVSNYKVENLEYSAEESILLRDIEDDQTGGFGSRMGAMAQDVADFPGRESIKLLRDNGVCFDGSQFFGTSHTLGTGSNLLTYDALSNDGTSNQVVSLLKAGPMKPIIWQKRKDKGLRDNAASEVSEEERVIRYWYDYEGAAAFGFWWMAVKTNIIDTPTVVDLMKIIENVETAFRGMKLDKADAADDDYFINEQMTFDAASIVHIVNPRIESRVRKVLGSDTIVEAGVPVDNTLKGHGEVLVSGYLGG